MTLKEAIDIGRACGATTIGEVAGLIAKFYSEYRITELFPTEDSWERWCDEYENWRDCYEETFSLAFEDCKI